MLFIKKKILVLLAVFSVNLFSQETFLDEFSSVSYSNNDGTKNWATDWIESGDDNSANSGIVFVETGVLKVTDFDINSQYIYREADISSAATATLSFDYTSDLDGNGGNAETIEVQISNDGGSSFTTIGSFIGVNSGTFVQNITGYIASNTQVRFIGANRDLESNDLFTVDNFLISITILPRTILTNRCITYRVTPKPQATPTTKITIDNFEDGAPGGETFDVVIRNTTGETLDYQLIVENVPYGSIPNLDLGVHTLSTINNGDGTYTHIFTSTVPLAPSENNRRIRGDAPIPPGIGLACSCVYFVEI